MPLDALRTPDDRFDDLPDFPWAPRYVDDLPGYEGLRIARIDEGPEGADRVFLCLHGQPSWSFLYRKMIPPFLASGARVVAPDLLGFGRTDKPTDPAAYTFDLHRGMLVALIERLDLRRITLVCQDWGGLLGLTLPVDMPERFERLLVMNTALAVGVTPNRAFLAWQDYVRRTPDFDVGGLMRRSEPALTDAEVAAYDAPFPDARYKAGAQTFPLIVPTSPEMPGAALSRRAAGWWATEWSGPTFMAVGVKDPILGPRMMRGLRGLIRGCPAPMEVAEGGHFVQERGGSIAEAALAAWGGA